MSGFQITRRDITSALDKARAFRDVGMLHKPAIEGAVGALACQVESVAASLGYGVLAGRYGAIKVGPLHVDFLAGMALHGAALFGFTGKYGDHAHNFATGLIDGYAHRVGIGIGTRMAIAARKPPPNVMAKGGLFSVAGTNPRGDYHIAGTNPRGEYRIKGARRPAPLTPAEIAAMTSQVR